ncbi:hypothetical protein QYM36_017796 [Artemia franciscana]|uniref:Diacylglycerol kinase n=1 Tax=Artemia franciscana TaxID=6661 RepID=A0AA88H3G4_ARTSF|nr:hypothetical protein QYM36_017796 [Artemia franciscana]
MASISDDSGCAIANNHGHYFVKKTFHKPSCCHHCAELLWGLIGQGFTCEVCNFIIHERCLRSVVSPCTSISSALVENPVAHCWSEPGHGSKRRFCNVCRKRFDDSLSLRCEMCEYHVHIECQDQSSANCRQAGSFVPGRTLGDIKPTHHWREGNLPTGAKCAFCRKACWSSDCLTGWRCEWCGISCHAQCQRNVSQDCNFGPLAPIILPPYSVSTPRIALGMEAVMGGLPRRRDAISPRQISDEFPSEGRCRDGWEDGCSSRERDRSREREDKEEEILKVFDGDTSLRRGSFRLVAVPRMASLEHLLAAALWAFHIQGDPSDYFLCDAYNDEETELEDLRPIPTLTRPSGKRPAILLRFRESLEAGWVRVHSGRLALKTPELPKLVPVSSETSTIDLLREALPLFGQEKENPDNYSVCEVILDKGSVLERIMGKEEIPWEVLKQIGRESIRQMHMTRFYPQPRVDPHGSNVALYLGNLPPNLAHRQYEKILTDILGKENRFNSLGPIYYEYGSMVLTYTNSDSAMEAFYIFRESSYEDKHLLVMILPNVVPELIPPEVKPLLVFVNVKSGGCQGLELITSYRRLLNPYQVYDLDYGGPLPGLYVFRKLANYRILVCGGDGTIGWVLQCLDNVGQDSVCSSPPCAIVPLGTGNDLARVLRWGPGYSGAEDPSTLLRDVIDAEEIRLDRWTVVFHPEEKTDPNQAGLAGAANEENSQIFVMNNYFGLGIDADLCLDFHNAREENPNKFNSRLHNKGVYVKMGLRKMMRRRMCKDLHKEIKIEVDGKPIELPPVEGIIILNILSWGSGANPWGPEREEHFSTPNHWDGILEIVGVTGVLHLGQIQSGLRSAMRIAQGGHIRIKIISEIPIQVDGEPWVQSPGEVVVLKSALKATMLKKVKRQARSNDSHLYEDLNIYLGTNL